MQTGNGWRFRDKNRESELSPEQERDWKKSKSKEIEMRLVGLRMKLRRIQKILEGQSLKDSNQVIEARRLEDEIERWESYKRN